MSRADTLMRKPKPKLGFRNKNVDQQVGICASLLRGAEKLPPAIRETMALHELGDEIAATEELARRHRAVRSEARAVRAALLAQAARLRLTALGKFNLVSIHARTAAELQSAGLRLEKDRRSVGVPGVPLNLRAETGEDAGTARLMYRRPLRRCVFMIEHAEGPVPENWKYALTTRKTRPVLPNLTGGQYHWFRVAAVNNHGPGPWSQPVRVRVG